MSKRTLGTIRYRGEEHLFTNLWWDDPEDNESNLRVQLLDGRIVTFSGVRRVGHPSEPEVETVTLDMSGFKKVMRSNTLEEDPYCGEVPR